MTRGPVLCEDRPRRNHCLVEAPPEVSEFELAAGWCVVWRRAWLV
jgi:hypothetical protein